MIRNIIFDMDGVLIDTETLIMNVWEEIARKERISNIRHTLLQCIGITAPETEALFLQTYGRDFPYQKYRKAVSELFQERIQKDGLPVKPGVYELFDFLNENHYHIGLASSTREEIVRKEMESIGLLDNFHVIVCGDMVSHSKPHPEIYQKACELLGIAPSDCYAIEDSPNGIRSAHAAGMKAIMVPDLVQPDEKLLPLLFLKCNDLQEVHDFLLKQ